VLGPFYRENPPVLPHGASTAQKHFDNEETVFMEGYIKDTSGRPLAGVTLDIWEDAPNGLYENHDHDQPDYNLRGRFETDENGYFALRALRPVPYPIPADETAGELLRFMGHHPNRPGHLHFIVAKDGYRTLVSQIYDSSSKWLDNDSVFAVKDSLVGNFEKAKPEHGTDLYLRFDFTLKPEAAAGAGGRVTCRPPCRTLPRPGNRVRLFPFGQGRLRVRCAGGRDEHQAAGILHRPGRGIAFRPRGRTSGHGAAAAQPPDQADRG
jgi:catechol 1,2-dioxygenase